MPEEPAERQKSSSYPLNGQSVNEITLQPSEKQVLAHTCKLYYIAQRENVGGSSGRPTCDGEIFGGKTARSRLYTRAEKSGAFVAPHHF